MSRVATSYPTTRYNNGVGQASTSFLSRSSSNSSSSNSMNNGNSGRGATVHSAAPPPAQKETVHACPLCNHLYKDPRVLPCTHTYCLNCIRDKLMHNDRVTCAKCQYRVQPFDEADLNELPRNLILSQEWRNNVDKTSASLIYTKHRPNTPEREAKSLSQILTKTKITNGATSPFYNACRDNNINSVKHYLQQMSVEEVNQMEPNGSTAFHVAAYQGHEEIVELLLQKGACHSAINKYNCTPFDEAKTDKIKQMIRRRTNNTRFISDCVEWILSTNDADYQAHEYWKKLESYGKDPNVYQLIVYIKQNYVERYLQDIDGIDTIKQYFNMSIKEKDPVYLLKAYTAETGFYSLLNVHLAQLRLKI
ncbi:unnamed protein product [Adineta steineri]|uniref:RING-type domain-containing protein n=1 Tax=Adineta steineri TaxID=433720 RepID=A0A815EV79_9BILA|nr:unnamed protein product [Adineta steineri]CAF1582198.1 unnamed protein product [Adineta steineri]